MRYPEKGLTFNNVYVVSSGQRNDRNPYQLRTIVKIIIFIKLLGHCKTSIKVSLLIMPFFFKESSNCFWQRTPDETL
jgi:hypothetical protein